jgi:hypothetical protein
MVVQGSTRGESHTHELLYVHPPAAAPAPPACTISVSESVNACRATKLQYACEEGSLLLPPNAASSDLVYRERTRLALDLVLIPHFLSPSLSFVAANHAMQRLALYFYHRPVSSLVTLLETTAASCSACQHGTSLLLPSVSCSRGRRQGLPLAGTGSSLGTGAKACQRGLLVARQIGWMGTEYLVDIYLAEGAASR